MEPLTGTLTDADGQVYDIVATPRQPDPPGPGNTGVRPGVELTEVKGKTLITTPGQVFEGKRFTAPVIARASDATFRNCLFSYGSVFAGRMIAIEGADVGGILLEDCEIDGQGTAVLGLGYSRWTGRRLNVHSCSDGIRIATDCLLEDSWIHHLARVGTLHPDCLQTTGGSGSVVRRCTLEVANPDTGDLGNAAFQIGGETSPTSDLLIEECWISGGNYAINVGAGVIDYPTIVIRNNRFLGGWRYGPMTTKGGVVAVDNTGPDGKPLPNRP